EKFQGHSLLELYLETGRTHQIRVHLAHIGHPLVGDTTYGHASPLVDRHFLHAFHLGFKHPVSGESLEFQTGLPSDLTPALDALRQG
ncbi:MAG: RluA family pseudouridine synthase, partial [Chloroflexi bacterium]|nr:RluA family pseudouridine synthase [Chloroflexota bacterium]